MATTTRRAAAKPAPEPEVVEDEFDEVEDDELEDVTEEDEVEETPAPKAKRAAKPKTDGAPKAPAVRQPAIEFGSPWLAAYVTENTDETYDSRAIRMLLRKLAKDGALDREVGVTRERYTFSGPEDPTVVAVLEMITSGKAKELKQAGLQAVKDKAAAAKAAKAKAKAEAAEAEPEDEDDDMEEVEEETPAPKRRVAKAAAPAKAAPATRRRAAAAK